jgi:thioredoxin-like negative regulator of GroEL
VTLADLGRHHEALASLARASQGPPNAEILYQLARCQLAVGRTDEAAATAQRALAVDATHQPSRQLMAQLAARPQAAEPAVR